MLMNMYKWIDRLIYQEDKKAFPLLSFLQFSYYM